MALPRVYHPGPLTPAESTQLDERASHYIAHVLRAKRDDKIILFNGRVSGEYQAVITCITKHHVEIVVEFFLPRNVETPIDIYLAQGIARGEKMDFIVQKAVELGVKKIVPLVTEYCNVRLDEKRKESKRSHWHSVAISACEQSGRNQIPEIMTPVDFSTWLPNAEADQRFIFTPQADVRLSKESLIGQQSFLLLIGPEGGFSPPEINQALAQGFKPLNMGPRILRTETAALTAISFVQILAGDMGQEIDR